MHRHVLILCWFALITARMACGQPTVKSVDVVLEVKASPLQCFRALTDPWQLRFWLDALEATFIAEPGGPWRIKSVDGSIEEGLCLEVLPGERLAYIILSDLIDTVSVDFQWRQDGTGIRFHHVSRQKPDAMDRTAELDTYWSGRTRKLAAYLNDTPGCYIAFPIGSGPFPAVVLLHDRLGVNRTIRALADSLARSGYLGIAVDMFKGDVTADLNEADRFMQFVDDSASVQAVVRVINYVRQREDVQRNRIAVWGMGYGGSVAFLVAAAEPRLRACVSWYGSKLPGPDLQKRLPAPVLAIFGDQDFMHPRAEIEAFDQALVNAGVRVETVVMAGGHSFADPAFGEEYNELTATDAFRRTLLFLDKRLRL